MSKPNKDFQRKVRAFVYSCKGEYKYFVEDLSGKYEQIDTNSSKFKEDCYYYGLHNGIPQYKLEKFYDKVVLVANKFNWLESWV